MFPSLSLQTTSLPQPARPRTQQEYLIRTLLTLQIPCDIVDCSLDEDAKRTWRRKGRTDGKLPGFLVAGEFAGVSFVSFTSLATSPRRVILTSLALLCSHQTIEDFEYAVEDGRLRDFLGLDNLAPPPALSTPAPAAVASPLAPSPPPASAVITSDTLPLSTNLLSNSSAPSEASPPTKNASADDELLNSVGEDELEKLLREMEAEGM